MRVHVYGPDVPDTVRRKIDGIVEYDDLNVAILQSRMHTIWQADHMPDSVIMKLYRVVTGDKQPILGIKPALDVVKGQLDMDWHEVHDKEPSETMSENQKRRVTKASAEVSAEPTEDTAKTKAPRRTISALITNMLLEQKNDPAVTDEAIHAAIQENFPGTKAAENPAQHTNYYRSALVKDGRLEKRERPKKARAAKVGGGTQEVVEMESVEA